LILISAVLSQDEDRFLPADERAMVDRFLSKPISPDQLLAEVRALLAADVQSASDSVTLQ
jgi:DNA-binding response OmpR family regulator